MVPQGIAVAAGESTIRRVEQPVTQPMSIRRCISVSGQLLITC